jgi:hypothetical protein
MERETGIEPATSSLGSWRSTAELLPLGRRTKLAYHHRFAPTTATTFSVDSSTRAGTGAVFIRFRRSEPAPKIRFAESELGSGWDGAPLNREREACQFLAWANRKPSSPEPYPYQPLALRNVPLPFWPRATGYTSSRQLPVARTGSCQIRTNSITPLPAESDCFSYKYPRTLWNLIKNFRSHRTAAILPSRAGNVHGDSLKQSELL